jgi:hypothetical protein
MQMTGVCYNYINGPKEVKCRRHVFIFANFKLLFGYISILEIVALYCETLDFEVFSLPVFAKQVLGARQFFEALPVNRQSKYWRAVESSSNKPMLKIILKLREVLAEVSLVKTAY